MNVEYEIEKCHDKPLYIIFKGKPNTI